MKEQGRSGRPRSFAVVYEWSGRNFSAFAPDVPGCVATGKTRQDVEARFQSALQAHLDLMAEHGERLPEPTSQVGTVEVEVPEAKALASP